MSKTTRTALIATLLLTLAASCLAGSGWVITRISEHQQVLLPQLLKDAEQSELVLIGEAHDNKVHHAIQLALIKALVEKKVPIAIGLEMFEAESQQALDDWSAGKLSEQEFQAIYARNWSLDWNLYRDIFLFARDNHIPMAGLNVPKELVLKVSRDGYASLSADEKKRLPQGTSCDLNNPHTEFLKESFEEVFKHETKGRVFTYFCEAQTVRNSGMAVNTERYLARHPGRKIVVLAGIWHAVKNAIPEQLERNDNPLRNTVILPQIPELKPADLTPDVADYLVTP
jgi:uncharacterized iron-regulated protein